MTLNRKPMPPRTTPLARGTGLTRAGGLERRAGLAPVSARRRAENRVRRQVIAAVFPERPVCAVPGCSRWADDVHEPLTRARGGSITDPGNMAGLCRGHHDEITFRPESELGWAYDLGLLRHSWDRPDGEAA